MKWVHEIGYVTATQFATEMGTTKRVTNRRLQKLEAVGMIARKRVFWNYDSIITLTKNGIDAVGSELAQVKNIALGSLGHDLQLIDLSIELRRDYAGSNFVSERLLRHELGLKGVGQFGHVSDGHLLLQNGERIAVELELTPKQNWRLEKIVSSLRYDASLDAVWYFCPPNVSKRVAAVVGDDPFFKITSIGATQ